jgi:hypothetical protein
LRLDEMRVDDVAVLSAKKGDIVTFPVQEVIRTSDQLYKFVSV